MLFSGKKSKKGDSAPDGGDSAPAEAPEEEVRDEETSAEKDGAEKDELWMKSMDDQKLKGFSS